MVTSAWLLVLVPQLVSAFSIGDNDEFGLRFLIGVPNAVMMYDPESRKSELSTVMNINGIANNVNYHFRKGLAFTYSYNTLFRSPLLSKFNTPSPPVRVPIYSCNGFTVDWEADVIYISDYKNNSILSATLEGDNVTTFLRLPEEHADIDNMEVDPYYRLLIWTAGGVLESCDLSGRNFRTNLSNPEYVVRATTLHLATRTIYYISYNPGTWGNELFSLRYDQREATPQRLVALDHWSMYKLTSLQVFRDHIYWMNYNDCLYKAPLNVSTYDDVAPVKVFDKATWSMRLVHPELQSRPVSLKPSTTIASFRSAMSGSDMKYEGCYLGVYFPEGWFYHIMNQFNLSGCLTFCRDSGSRYMGIADSYGDCSCGDNIPDEWRRPNDICDTPCPGEDVSTNLTCGGQGCMSVYDLEPANTPNVEFGLRFLIGVNDAVMMYDPDSQKSELSTVMNVDGRAKKVNYHFRKGLAFTYTNHRLFRSPLLSKFNTPSPPVRVPNSICNELSRHSDFTVDWEADVIYISDCNNRILSATLEGDNVTTFLQRPEEYVDIENMEVDPYYRLLIWTADGMLESCDLSGQNFRTNLSDPEYFVHSTTLHLATRTIYYTLHNFGRWNGLFSLRYDQRESSPQRLVTLDEMGDVYGLGVFRDHMYWMNYGDRDILYKAPLNVSTSDEVVLVKVLEKYAYTMRLVHSELQSRPVSLEPSTTIDGQDDCGDASDENNCTDTLLHRPCTAEEFQCGDKLCIPRERVCDGTIDCLDKSDELSDCTNNLTWHGAFVHCASNGMALASIESEEEQNAVRNLIAQSVSDTAQCNDYSYCTRWWLGGSDLHDDGNYIWYSNGRPLTYRHFHTGEPNALGTENDCLHDKEHCIEMRVESWFDSQWDYEWNDTPCTRQSYAVCEYFN